MERAGRGGASRKDRAGSFLRAVRVGVARREKGSEGERKMENAVMGKWGNGRGCV